MGGSGAQDDALAEVKRGIHLLQTDPRVDGVWPQVICGMRSQRAKTGQNGVGGHRLSDVTEQPKAACRARPCCPVV